MLCQAFVLQHVHQSCLASIVETLSQEKRARLNYDWEQNHDYTTAYNPRKFTTHQKKDFGILVVKSQPI